MTVFMKLRMAGSISCLKVICHNAMATAIATAKREAYRGTADITTAE